MGNGFTNKPCVNNIPRIHIVCLKRIPWWKLTALADSALNENFLRYGMGVSSKQRWGMPVFYYLTFVINANSKKEDE